MMRRQSPARRMMSYMTDLLTTDTYAKEVKIFTLPAYFIERFRRLARPPTTPRRPAWSRGATWLASPGAR